VVAFWAAGRGAYLDPLALIAIVAAGRHFAPKWVSQDGSAMEIKSRIARMRKPGRSAGWREGPEVFTVRLQLISLSVGRAT
jgi:hypothetical protein